MPIAQNLMFRSREEALRCPVGTLDILRCLRCGFAWNRAFAPDLLVYGVDYESDQTLSPSYRRHLDIVAARIESLMEGRSGIAGVEMGCGQGQFLSILSAIFGDRIACLIGFDPAFRPSSPLPKGTRVERMSFSESTRGRLGANPDFVVTRHVIEHVANPIAFLAAIRAACAEGTPLVVETPNLDWILDGAVVHDLYYEHCSLFDAGSLGLALRAAGFEPEEINVQFDGQYLVAVARASSPRAPAPRSRVANTDYPRRKADYVTAVKAALERDVAAGEKVALWGGASKGVTLALLLGDRLDLLEMAIDINPVRAGTFMPVTGLPVVLPESARPLGITKAYVMNPAYFAEIEIYCRDEEWPLKLASIDSCL